jgi:hypothetical protein
LQNIVTLSFDNHRVRSRPTPRFSEAQYAELSPGYYAFREVEPTFSAACQYYCVINNTFCRNTYWSRIL